MTKNRVYNQLYLNCDKYFIVYNFFSQHISKGGKTKTMRSSIRQAA